MDFEDCSCSGHNLDRFLRPCVMAVLARRPEGLHGYLVAQHLQQISFFEDSPPDLTGLYRVLKSMEAEGYLESSWDDESSGPARRIYCITPAGVHCLCQWTRTLGRYARDLHYALEFVEQSLGASSGEANCCAGNACEC